MVIEVRVTEVMTQGIGGALEAGKGMDFPLEPPEGPQSHRPISDLWRLEFFVVMVLLINHYTCGNLLQQK